MPRHRRADIAAEAVARQASEALPKACRGAGSGKALTRLLTREILHAPMFDDIEPDETVNVHFSLSTDGHDQRGPWHQEPRVRYDADPKIDSAFMPPTPVNPDDERVRLKAPKLATGQAARRIPAAFRGGQEGPGPGFWEAHAGAARRIGAAAVPHMPRNPWASGPISLARMPGRLVCCAHDGIGTRRRRAAAPGGPAAPAE